MYVRARHRVFHGDPRTIRSSLWTVLAARNGFENRWKTVFYERIRFTRFFVRAIRFGFLEFLKWLLLFLQHDVFGRLDFYLYDHSFRGIIYSEE